MSKGPPGWGSPILGGGVIRIGPPGCDDGGIGKFGIIMGGRGIPIGGGAYDNKLH